MVKSLAEQRPHMAINGNAYAMSEGFQIIGLPYNSNGGGNRFLVA
jgi:hypothetical protein